MEAKVPGLIVEYVTGLCRGNDASVDTEVCNRCM